MQSCNEIFRNSSKLGENKLILKKKFKKYFSSLETGSILRLELLCTCRQSILAVGEK